MPRRSPGTGGLHKRANDGLWVASVSIPTTGGTRKRLYVSSKNRNEAVAKLKELRKQIDAGQTPGTGRVKVSVYLEQWLTTVQKYKVKPNTYAGDVRAVKLYLNPHIGNIRLDRLTPADIRTMLEALRKSSDHKAWKAHKILRTALGQAVKDGTLIRNPAEAVDTVKVRSNPDPAFSPAEAMHILATADSYCDETWASRWAAGFMTGLREAELIGLEWDRVDLSKRALDITWQLQDVRKQHGCGERVGDVYPCGKEWASACPKGNYDHLNADFEHRVCEGVQLWTRPKTQRSDRGVPIIAPLHDRLTRLAAIDGPNPHNLVFHYPNGKPITQSQDQAAWRQLLIKAGMPHRRQHTLRRTCATLLRAAQVDEQTRMGLLGHASADVHRLYAGSNWEQESAAMGKLADMYSVQDLDEPQV